MSQVQNGLGNCCNSLTGLVGGKVDGKVRQTKDTHQGNQPLLADELPAMVVGGVVGKDRVDKLHHIVDVVHERDRLFLGARGQNWSGLGCTRLLSLEKNIKDNRREINIPCHFWCARV